MQLIFISFLILLALVPLISSFQIQQQHHRIICTRSMPTQRMSSTWDDFSYDDDDELLDSGVDSDFVAADENDDAAVKAEAGAALEAPEVDYDGPTIDVPQGKFVLLLAMCRCFRVQLSDIYLLLYCFNYNIGSTLDLDEETVQGVLAACRQEIG